MKAHIDQLPRPLIVGVSGGADSTFLLHSLMTENPEGVIVCHLNHGLRGADADMDARFVQELAQKYGVPYEEKKIDLPRLMEAKGETSFETLAREERLRFFKEVGEKYIVKDVALGHHADDQAETVLMNLCRGSAGLKGIERVGRLKEMGLTIHRPLLNLRKEEIISALKEKGHRWREDLTNQEAIATRNRVRNEVIPLLNEVFKRDASPNIIRSMQSTEVRSLLPEILIQMQVYDPQGRLFLPKLLTFSESLQKAVIHTFLTEQGVPDLSDAKISECLCLLHEPEVWKVNLPTGKFLRRKEKRIFLGG